MDGFFNSIEVIVRDLTDLKRKNMKYWKSHKNLKNSVSIYLMLVEAYFQACLAGVWVDFPCFELVSIVDVSQKWCLAQAEKCNQIQNWTPCTYFIKSSYYTLFENYLKCRIWISTFFINFHSGNTVWPQTSNLQKFSNGPFFGIFNQLLVT